MLKGDRLIEKKPASNSITSLPFRRHRFTDHRFALLPITDYRLPSYRFTCFFSLFVLRFWRQELTSGCFT
jgi:hypothetical protein